jgi:hypothetical protein
MRSGSAVVLAFALVACAEQTSIPDEAPALELSVDGAVITGSYVHAGSVVAFRSESKGPQRATLQLDVNGAVLELDLDLGAQLYSEDGNLNALQAEDRAALLAMRDAVMAAHPELIETLHGKVLVRHADRMAEAPIGLTLDRRVVDMAAATASRFQDRADADGCGGDGATCLWGTNGWDYAVYDPGNDGTCVWTWAQYGENQANCSGRCGAGCNHWFDDDYTWDCFDHDRCVDHYGGSTMSGNPNCGDEFWDAADDYALTYGAWC